MRPLNQQDRRKEILAFSAYFAITLLFLFVCGIFTLTTAQKGVSLLEQKKESYDITFKKQAEVSFHLDEIFKHLYNLKNKRRNAGEHRQMQQIISNKRTEIEKIISSSSIDAQHYHLYHVLLTQIKVVQETMDVFEKESDKRLYNIEQLEKCRKKYQELSKQRNN